MSGKGEKAIVRMIYRDSERDEKVSLATCNSITQNRWQITDLTHSGVGAWEPSYDTELWKNKKQIHVFLQNVEQIDSEGVAKSENEMINVLELKL
mgnify:FL=1